MNSTQALAQYRLDVRDTYAPYLWSDAEVFTYLDDAHKMFCRLTGGIADATSTTCTKLRAKAGVSFVAISPRVLKIRAAFAADGRKLELINMEDLEFSDTMGKELFVGNSGRVEQLVLGMEPNKAKLINTPTVDETLSLIVYRMPLDDIVGLGQDFEIDEQHHLHLIKWARHLGHNKPDAETYDRGRSNQFKQEFETYCAMAKDEKGQREHKHRAAQFSW